MVMFWYPAIDSESAKSLKPSLILILTSVANFFVPPQTVLEGLAYEYCPNCHTLGVSVVQRNAPS